MHASRKGERDQKPKRGKMATPILDRKEIRADTNKIIQEEAHTILSMWFLLIVQNNLIYPSSKKL
jgi:hypothetical protein